MKRLVYAMVIMVGVGCSAGGRNFEQKVRQSVTEQMERHPASHLKDLYKSFLQDRFGPGYTIKEVSTVRDYMEEELAIYEDYPDMVVEMAEPTGYEHNFYRVSLGELKSGHITVEQLADAVVRSANGAKHISVKKWKREWARIEQVVRSMNLSLNDYDKELKEINKALEKGIYTGHHSEIYNFAYTPNYVIISRKIYEKELRPLLETNE
jgi:hypothetical protein